MIRESLSSWITTHLVEINRNPAMSFRGATLLCYNSFALETLRTILAMRTISGPVLTLAETALGFSCLYALHASRILFGRSLPISIRRFPGSSYLIDSFAWQERPGSISPEKLSEASSPVQPQGATYHPIDMTMKLLVLLQSSKLRRSTQSVSSLVKRPREEKLRECPSD